MKFAKVSPPDCFLKKAKLQSSQMLCLHFQCLSSSFSMEERWAPLASPALAEGSSGGGAVPCCSVGAPRQISGALASNEKWENSPGSIWCCHSLGWNQLGRGRRLQLMSPSIVNLTLLEKSQLVFRDSSVPRKLFVMISLLAFCLEITVELKCQYSKLEVHGVCSARIRNEI